MRAPCSIVRIVRFTYFLYFTDLARNVARVLRFRTRPGQLAAQILGAWRARGPLHGRSWRQCDRDVAHRPASRMVRTGLDMVHCFGAAGCRLLLLDAGCCFSTSLVSTNAGAPALRSCRFVLPRPFAGAVRQQDCSAAFVLIGQRAAARAAARGWQRERAWRKGSPTWAKRLQQAAAAASCARWRAAVRHSAVHGCRELCGILTPGALWEHERSVAVAAPTAVSSGLVHLVGLQSRHTAQKGR